MGLHRQDNPGRNRTVSGGRNDREAAESADVLATGEGNECLSLVERNESNERETGCGDINAGVRLLGSLRIRKCNEEESWSTTVLLALHTLDWSD